MTAISMIRLLPCYVLAACLLLLSAGLQAKSSSGEQTLYQLNCPGRTTMTVARAQGGLSTLSWHGHHFQVAATIQRQKLTSGQTLTLTQFRNGDRLIVNADTGNVWFAYRGESHPVRCQGSEPRKSQVITLQTWYPHNDAEA